MDNRLLISVAALFAACALSLTAHAGEGSKSGEAEVQKMDTNRDGRLTAQEVEAGHKAMLKKTN